MSKPWENLDLNASIDNRNSEPFLGRGSTTETANRSYFDVLHKPGIQTMQQSQL